MSGTLPPLEHISADDHGPVVTVLVIIFACISVTSALVRVYVSIKRRLAFGIDDAFCFAALVCFDLLTWRLLRRAHQSAGDYRLADDSPILCPGEWSRKAYVDALCRRDHELLQGLTHRRPHQIS